MQTVPRPGAFRDWGRKANSFARRGMSVCCLVTSKTRQSEVYLMKSR